MLTLDQVPDDLLAECGVARGGASTPSYRCTDPTHVLIPTAEVIGSGRRKLNRDALAKILRGFRDDDSIPPVEVIYGPEPHEFILLDGMHRWRASEAFGFAELPCLLVEREWAEVARGYQPRR